MGGDEQNMLFGIAKKEFLKNLIRLSQTIATTLFFGIM